MSLLDIAVQFQTRTGDALTFDEPVGDLPVVHDARWSASFTDHSFAALLVWVAMLFVLQLVAWPLARRIFTRLPDRGWAFARPLTLLIAGYGVWLLSSIHLISFRAAWAWVAIGAVAIISWLLRRRVEPARDDPTVTAGNHVIVGAEVVFWVVFVVFLLFRAINPDSYHPIWGGEKPMEFAHLNAILRSAHFPPVDPWFAGGFINYYYYGTYLVAFMIKLTGIPAEIAFNLAQPTFIALLASGAFSISAAIGRRLTSSVGASLLIGIVGMFFVSFAGNMISAARVIDRAVKGIDPGDTFSYWVFSPTRAIPDGDGNAMNITEFPYFAGLYADLHPHTLAMPFTILVIALAWQLASQWRILPMVFVQRKVEAREAYAFSPPLILLALALGTIFMTNAWDLPMFAAIGAVGITMATQSVPRRVQRIGVIAVGIVAVGVVAILLILPFTLNYIALFNEIDTVRDNTPFHAIQSHLGAQLLLITVGMAAAVWPNTRISRERASSWALSGAVLIIAGLVMQWVGRDQSDTLRSTGVLLVAMAIMAIWAAMAWTSIREQADFKVHPVALQTELVTFLAVALALIVFDQVTLAFYLVLGISAAILWFALARPSARFVAALIAGATLLGGMLEIVYVVDDLSGGSAYRMNTIFKFYNQIWNLLGIAVGILIGKAVWETLTPPLETNSIPPQSRREPTAWSWIATAISLPLAIATLSFAVVGTPIRLDESWGPRQGLTLDAYTWMDYGEMRLTNGETVTYDDDRAAIDWFNREVEGTPVIAEAAFGAYRCNGSRYSIATGLPAPIGWQRHQMQQRYWEDIAGREDDLRELYTSPDVERKLEIIDQYDIRYVVLGETERAYPTINGNDCVDSNPDAGIAVLEGMSSEHLEVAFQKGTTTVYRVVGD